MSGYVSVKGCVWTVATSTVEPFVVFKSGSDTIKGNTGAVNLNACGTGMGLITLAEAVTASELLADVIRNDWSLTSSENIGSGAL